MQNIKIKREDEYYIPKGYELPAEYDIYFCTPFETLKGYLADKMPNEVMHTYGRLKVCTCGGSSVILKETERMGDFDCTIGCLSCGRFINRSMYDFDVNPQNDYMELCIRDWNDGLTQEDVEMARIKEQRRIRLRKSDLIWLPIYPNNMPCNKKTGVYTLVFKLQDGLLTGYKWSIEFQRIEEEPGLILSDAKVELYNLFLKRYTRIKGHLYYPEPTDVLQSTKERNTFSALDINDKGEFVRSYMSMKEAREGALARCGWFGINRETIYKEERKENTNYDSDIIQNISALE